MTVRAFVDTNVLVYLFDSRVPTKRAQAAKLFELLGTDQYVTVLSTQVLQEAYVALTRKLAIDADEVLESLQQLEQSGVSIQGVSTSMVWLAATRAAKDQLSFWDALIVTAALESGCTILFSEDMQAGRKFDGLEIRNPFNLASLRSSP